MHPDVLRQRAVAATIVAGLVSGATGDYRDARTSTSRVLPAPYAFAIWGPIYAGALAYALHQARPSRRADALLRRTGWPTAATFGLAGLWVRLKEHPALQLPVIGATTAAAALAYGRAESASAQEAGSDVDRWIVRVPLGLTAGWLSVATVAATTEDLIAFGARDPWPGSQAWAAVTLGGTAALAATVADRVPASAGFPAAVVWGLLGIAVRELPDRPLSGGAALLSASAVVVSRLRRMRR